MAALDAQISLLQGQDRRSIWKRESFFAAGDVYPLENFSTTQGLLRNEMLDLLINYSNRIINEIRFTR